MNKFVTHKELSNLDHLSAEDKAKVEASRAMLQALIGGDKWIKAVTPEEAGMRRK